MADAKVKDDAKPLEEDSETVKDARTAEKKINDEFNNNPEIKQLYKQIRDIQAKQMKVHKQFEAAFYTTKKVKSTNKLDPKLVEKAQEIVQLAMNVIELGENAKNTLIVRINVNDILLKEVYNVVYTSNKVYKNAIGIINDLYRKDITNLIQGITTIQQGIEKKRTTTTNELSELTGKAIQIAYKIIDAVTQILGPVFIRTSISDVMLRVSAEKINNAKNAIDKVVAALPDGIKQTGIEAQREAEDAVKKADNAKEITGQALKLAKEAMSEQLTPKQKLSAAEKAKEGAISAENAIQEVSIAISGVYQKITIATEEANTDAKESLSDAIQVASATAKDVANKAKAITSEAKTTIEATVILAQNAKQEAIASAEDAEDAIKSAEKMIEDNVNERTNMLVLLNDLINETSIISTQTDRRYLYTMEYKLDKNQNMKVFENEDIKEVEPTFIEKQKETASKTVENALNVGKKTSRIVQDVGNKIGRIFNNKLTKAENKSKVEAESSTKLARAQEEAKIAQAETAENLVKREENLSLLPQSAQAGGQSDDLNTKLSFIISKDDIDKIIYKDLIIVQYSTKNTEEIDKNLTPYDYSKAGFYQYIANFQEYIKNNKEGKNMNYADRTKDRSLLVKRYPIHQYFNVFNKNNGFDYKGIKATYLADKDAFKKNVDYYSNRLDKFFEDLDNFRDRDNLNTIKNNFGKGINNIWYNLKNYYGFIIIILALIALFYYHLQDVLTFFNSVYSRKMSLSPSIMDNSMYNGYAEIYSLNMFGIEQYYEKKTMYKAVMYGTIFFLIVLINLWYISDSLSGRLRVCNFIPHYWSTSEVYIFDKRANTIMYYGVLFLIFVIILNILYYLSVFSQSDIYKTRYESNKALNELYQNMDTNLLHHLLATDVTEDGETLTKFEDKLANWMYNGTEAELNTRIGNRNNSDDMYSKRFKILMTIVFIKHYIAPKYKKALLEYTDINDFQNNPPDIFLYSREEMLDGVLPQNYDIVIPSNSDIMNTIIGPPVRYSNKIIDGKCVQDDTRYFCQKEQKQNYVLEGIEALNTRYTTYYKKIQAERRKIKSKDSAILYRVDVILSFLCMLIIGICLIQIFLWLFFDNIDIYEAFIIKHKSKLKTIFQVIVVVIILIVIL